MKKLMMVLMILFCLLPDAQAAPFEEQTTDAFTWYVDHEGWVHITDWQWESLPEIPETVTVPATLGGYPVQNLHEDAFSTPGLEASFTLVIPEGIRGIYGAFRHCGASTICLPASLGDISEGSFAGCHAVVTLAADSERIRQEEGFLLQASLSRDDAVLLYTNPSPSRADLPDVKTIGEAALDNWIGDAQELSIHLPERVTHVGWHDLPNGVVFHTDNPETTFTARTQDSEYDYRPMPDGSAVITWWQPLTSEPDTVYVPTEVGGRPVYTLGRNVFNTSEGWIETAFRLVIPEGITGCEGDPFFCCHEASEILLPSTFAGDLTGCFYHVGAEITVAAGNPAYTVRDGFLIDTRSSTLVYMVPSDAGTPLPAVRHIGNNALINWCNSDAMMEQVDLTGHGMTLVIPEGVETLGSTILYGNVGVTDIVLPSTLTRLEDHALYGTLLHAVTLPENVVFVGYEAFDADTVVTALNPDCEFETETAYLVRTRGENDGEYTWIVDEQGNASIAKWHWEALTHIR